MGIVDCYLEKKRKLIKIFFTYIGFEILRSQRLLGALCG